MFEVRSLVAVRCVSGGEPGGGAEDRLALGPAVDATERIAAVARLVSVFLLDHVVEIPWAAALPPGAGRNAPQASQSEATLRALARVAAEQLPQTRVVREALARASGVARQSARGPAEWT